MNLDFFIGGLIAAALIVYLIYSILFPEKL